MDIVRKRPGEMDEDAIDRLYSDDGVGDWSDGDEWIHRVHDALLRFDAGWVDLTEATDRGPVLSLLTVQVELGPGDITIRAQPFADWALVWAVSEALRREFGTATSLNAGELVVVDPWDELGDDAPRFADRLPHPA